MLPCKHHCMPQSTSLFYMRVFQVTFSCCHGGKRQSFFNSSLQVSVFEFSSTELLDHPILIKNNMASSPALNTCIGVLGVPWVLKQFSHFTVSSPAVDKPERNLTKLTILTHLIHFHQLDQLDPCLTNCWPTVHQLFTKFVNFSPNSPTFHQIHQLFTKFTNFSPTSSTFHQICQLFAKLTNFSPISPTSHQIHQLFTNLTWQQTTNCEALAVPAKIERTYWIATIGGCEPNNCHQSSIWGCLKVRCSFFRLKFISYSFLPYSVSIRRFSPWKLIVTSEFHWDMCGKKTGGNIRWQTYWAIVFSRVLFSPSTWPTNPSV